MAKKTKSWIIEQWARSIMANGMTIDQIADDRDRKRVEKMIRQIQKPVDPRQEIASDLDRAAQRAEIVNQVAASSKQCWYLAGLLHEQKLTAEAVNCGCLNTQAVLSKGRASKLIESLKTGTF